MPATPSALTPLTHAPGPAAAYLLREKRDSKKKRESDPTKRVRLRRPRQNVAVIRYVPDNPDDRCEHA